MTDSVVKDILIGTVGSPIAASLAWLVALIARSKRPLQDERQPVVLAALIPDIGDLAAASPRGPLWQGGRHGLLIATLGLSILVAIADIPSPPFGLPPLMRFMSAGTGQSYRDLLDEADKMLRDAQWEEERLLRAAQFEAESIMDRAAWSVTPSGAGSKNQSLPPP
jgi:hypothetical protein